MKLYRSERVEQAEKSPAFREAKKKQKRRHGAAQKARATKLARIAQYVGSLKIEVPELEKDELIRLACANYNAGSREGPKASESSDPEFLARISVNYLRHSGTQYEQNLKKIAGRMGAGDAYLDIKTKVLNAISAAYRWLEDECERQEKRMWDREMEPV
jgi:hypothetical protein